MFNHYKTNANVSLRVRLFDTSFVAVAGVADSSTTVTLVLPSGSTSGLTLTTHYTWSEITTGAFSGKGLYLLTILQGALSGAGEYTVAIDGLTGSTVAEFSCYSELPADNFSRLGAPAGASVSADIAAVKSAVGSPATSLTIDVAAVSAKLGTPAGASVSADIAAVASDVDPVAIADAVWDASTAGNIGAGTMGGLVNDAANAGGGGATAEDIADAVWNESVSGHAVAGSFGELATGIDTKLGTPSTSVAADIADVKDDTNVVLKAITNGKL